MTCCCILSNSPGCSLVRSFRPGWRAARTMITWGFKRMKNSFRSVTAQRRVASRSSSSPIVGGFAKDRGGRDHLQRIQRIDPIRSPLHKINDRLILPDKIARLVCPVPKTAQYDPLLFFSPNPFLRPTSITKTPRKSGNGLVVLYPFELLPQKSGRRASNPQQRDPKSK